MHRYLLPVPDSVKFPGVYVQELAQGARAISAVATDLTAFIGRARTGPVNEAVTLCSFEEFERTFGGLWERSTLGFAVWDFFSNGGTRAIIVRLRRGDDRKPLTLAEFLPPNGEVEGKGLFALQQADLFNLLCIPPHTSDLLVEGGNTDPRLVAAAAAYCEKRRAMLIVDPPVEWDSVSKAQQGIGDAVSDPIGTRSANAAAFFPRIMQPNPLANHLIQPFAPCGAVAGIFARTDASRGVWKAPAGLEARLAGNPQPSVSIDDAGNSQLNPRGVNCLRRMPNAGCVIWGSRTLQGDDRFGSEWKYIPVRRTALFIEESLVRGTQWAAFEPNDETLWTSLRQRIETFLHTLFRQGAFIGGSPREAYFVKCDTEITTRNDIGLGIVNILVGFAPLKPAEFILLKIQQVTGRSS